MKYYGKIRATGEWVEIHEYRFNALCIGHSWGIYCAAKSERV